MEKKCITCGNQFISPYPNQKYCSAGCAARSKFGGELVDLICECCGKKYCRQLSRLKHGRGKNCSRECQYVMNRQKLSRQKVECKCLNCDKVFYKCPSQFTAKSGKKGAGKYCCRKCRDLHWIGQNNPLYIDGSREYRGTNWQAQKRAAKKRDNSICQHCGVAGNDVHHIIPYRHFAEGEFLAANDLSNLITLCKQCHRIADAEIQAIERSSHAV